MLQLQNISSLKCAQITPIIISVSGTMMDSTGQHVEIYVLTMVSSESQCAIAMYHTPALYACISPQQVGISTTASYIWFKEWWQLRWKSLWKDRTYFKALYRLSIDFTCMAPTTQGWSRLATLLSVNWITWQTVGRAIMLILWKLFSILSIPSPFVLYYIQILGLRRDCKKCSWTVHVYYGIYAGFLRICCIFIGIIVGWLVT